MACERGVEAIEDPEDSLGLLLPALLPRSPLVGVPVLLFELLEDALCLRSVRAFGILLYVRAHRIQLALIEATPSQFRNS